MTPIGFENFRAGRESCPSNMKLWRYHLEELKADDTAQVRAHAGGCAACTADLARFAGGLDAVPQGDTQRLLAAIRRKQPAPRPGWGERWRLALRWLAAPMAVGAAALAFVVVRPGLGPHGDSRAKGQGAVLHLLRATHGEVEEVSSGERFYPGDRLRFSLDLDAAASVELIGVDATGHLYRVWPSDDQALPLPAGKRQPLATAVELDEASGNETLYVVACPPDEQHPTCVSRGAQAPACKPACRTTPFVLRKTP